mgnify:CR=1 FL=1
MAYSDSLARKSGDTITGLMTFQNNTFVTKDTKLFLSYGDTVYFKYNSTSTEVELYKGATLLASWTTT